MRSWQVAPVTYSSFSEIVVQVKTLSFSYFISNKFLLQ
uniref:Uncharacterized protein n=1 Tax=Siphoviridae sp. ctvyM23 TaxID=2826514 RepID=A0A8S5MHR1_9CAUD|nr:MAG TPA: hypothetical protein [Siphoviridae sp. ctvyM23]